MLREWREVGHMLRGRSFGERLGFFLFQLKGMFTGKVPGMDEREGEALEARALEVMGMPPDWRFNPTTEEEMDVLYEEIDEYRRKRVNEIYDGNLPNKHLEALKVVIVSEILDVEFMKTHSIYREGGKLVIRPADDE